MTNLTLPEAINEIEKLIEVPTFSFALRQDLVEDKRFLPTRGNEQATGWDVRAAMLDRKSITLRPGQRALIQLGFRAFCPPGWWYELKSRSSSFAKKNLHGHIGTIDEDYEGELLYACQYIPDVSCLAKDLVIDFGDALGQIIPKKRPEVKMIEATNEELDSLFSGRKFSRGTGGFGSTGK